MKLKWSTVSSLIFKSKGFLNPSWWGTVLVPWVRESSGWGQIGGRRIGVLEHRFCHSGWWWDKCSASCWQPALEKTWSQPLSGFCLTLRSVTYTKSSPHLSCNTLNTALHTAPYSSNLARSIPRPGNMKGPRRLPQAVPRIPVGWAGAGRACSVKVSPITLQSGAHSTQRLCWVLAEASGATVSLWSSEIFHFTQSGVVNGGDTTWRAALLSNLQLPP